MLSRKNRHITVPKRANDVSVFFIRKLCCQCTEYGTSARSLQKPFALRLWREIGFCDDDFSFEFLKIFSYVAVKKLMLTLGIAGKEFFLRNDTVKKLLTAVEYQRVGINFAISVGGGTVICSVMGNLQNITF